MTAPKPDPMVEGMRRFVNDLTRHSIGRELSSPIVNDEPENMDDTGIAEFIHEQRKAEQAEDAARNPDGFFAKLARRTEQYRKHPERAALDMLNAEELIRQMQQDAKELRQWVSNLSARVPV